MPLKHLVLEDDVHRDLRRKKDQTGLTVRDIGNCILRAILKHELLGDAVCSKLVDRGIVSREQLVETRKQVVEELRASCKDVSDLVRHSDRDTLISGSWALRELYCAPDGSFQIVSARARDHRKRPFLPHTHASEELFVVLTGSLFITIDDRNEIVSAPGYVRVPQQAIHSTTPGSSDTLVLGILQPAEPSYMH